MASIASPPNCTTLLFAAPVPDSSRTITCNGRAAPLLLVNLLALIAAHRPAFRREQPYRRALALFFGELSSFARHTVTQGLLALGATDVDWSAWYRLFSRPRFSEEQLARCLLRETQVQARSDQPYVIGVDSTQVPRTSLKMPGTGWLRALRTVVFRRGLHRAQHFLHGAWLPGIEQGYSRAIPLRFLPAFPEKAVPTPHVASCKEWAAGLALVQWVRKELDEAGRRLQSLLVRQGLPYAWSSLQQSRPYGRRMDPRLR